MTWPLSGYTTVNKPPIVDGTTLTETIVLERGEHELGLTARHAWAFVVERFPGTLLSEPADALPAISAVAAVYGQKRFGLGKYCAGIWDGQLAQSLARMSMDPKKAYRRQKSASDQYIAPSFSWASQVGTVSYETASEITTGYVNELKAYSTVRALSAPFGQAQSGRLEGKMLVIEASIGHRCSSNDSAADFTTKGEAPHKLANRNESDVINIGNLSCGCDTNSVVVSSTFLCASVEGQEGWFGALDVHFDIWDDGMDALGGTVYCIPLGEKEFDRGVGCTSMMVLQRTGNEEGVYRRIGLIVIDPDCEYRGNFLHDILVDLATKQAITIV